MTLIVSGKDATTGQARDAENSEAITDQQGNNLGGGTPRQETLASQVITGTDTALVATLAFTPVSNASVNLSLNGVQQPQGAGLKYTISGVTITWLASSGTAVDLDTSDSFSASYTS